MFVPNVTSHAALPAGGWPQARNSRLGCRVLRHSLQQRNRIERLREPRRYVFQLRPRSVATAEMDDDGHVSQWGVFVLRL